MAAFSRRTYDVPSCWAVKDLPGNEYHIWLNDVCDSKANADDDDTDDEMPPLE
ncbi:hypothetical protein B0H14DRAFT_3852811 [Mycena olivaceomarginata]|nr:hypothetical protein B0H14DRAFT_3852811 [Mycena olivaceomarginata]